MNDQHIKQQVQNALQRFVTSDSMLANATALFKALGYRSNKTLVLNPNTAWGFQDTFGSTRDAQRALTSVLCGSYALPHLHRAACLDSLGAIGDG